MKYTVKQLADLLNVSKGTITNYSNQLKLDLAKNDHGVIIMTIDQCISIAEAINENRTELNKVNIERLYELNNRSNIKMSDDLKKSFQSFNQDTANTEQSKLIELLQKQIKELKQDKAEYKEQLKVKDNQIKQLNDTLNEQQKLLHNQQSLQLQSNEKIKALEIELQEVKEDTSQADKVQDTNKVDNFYKDLREDKGNKQSSFLSRLFKR